MFILVGCILSIKAKAKTAITEATTAKGIPLLIRNFLLGLALGFLVDFILEAIVWLTSEKGWGGVEVGFSIYYANPSTTKIPYDDVLLIIATIVMLFSKKLWFVFGFFVGWYVGSNTGIYGKLKPVWEEL